MERQIYAGKTCTGLNKSRLAVYLCQQFISKLLVSIYKVPEVGTSYTKACYHGIENLKSLGKIDTQ